MGNAEGAKNAKDAEEHMKFLFLTIPFAFSAFSAFLSIPGLRYTAPHSQMDFPGRSNA